MSLNFESDEVAAHVLKENALSVADAEKQVGQFLKKRHVIECLSAEDYSRLYGLREALAEETGAEKPKTKGK